MSSTVVPVQNVTAVVPLLMVTNMERALAFYVDGLGFTIQNQWVPDVRWCWMSLGNGVSLYFQCNDALAVYRDAATRGIHTLREPQVGNFSWEVVFADPDGYSIHFSSPTDLPEETLLSDVKT